MIHLKKFEDCPFIEITLQDVHRYQDISSDIDSNICKKLVDISNNYHFYIEESNDMWPSYIKFRTKSANPYKDKLKVSGMFFVGGTIFSNNDEWYYISLFTEGGLRDLDKRKYFKCDQWDGLVECLRSYILI